MNKSFMTALFSILLLSLQHDASGREKAKAKAKPKASSSSANLKESFRAIGHGFRDAGRSIGRDAKAATRAVKQSEKGR